MKTTIFSLFISLLAFTYASAQNLEGSITYSATTEGVKTGADDATQAQVEAMMKNMKVTMYFKDKNYRMDMDMGMMTNSSIKVDSKTTMLIDAMGMKYKLTLTDDMLKKQKVDDKDYDITYTDDKKTIAGYECKKAVVKTKDGKSYDIYYSDKVFPDAIQNFQYSKLKGGFPLQYTINKSGMTITMTATAVSMSPVPADTFTIPSDYQEMPDNMKSQMFPNSGKK